MVRFDREIPLFQKNLGWWKIHGKPRVFQNISETNSSWRKTHPSQTQVPVSPFEKCWDRDILKDKLDAEDGEFIGRIDLQMFSVIQAHLLKQVDLR